MSKLERIVDVRPAYDCIRVRPCVFGKDDCKPGGGGSHGIHNAELHLTVRGPDAEVTLFIGTGWDLPTVPKRNRLTVPWGMLVQFHTARPRSEYQDRSEPRPIGACKDWGGCYIDNNYRMADEPAKLLVAAGSDAVWAWLEQQYAGTLADMAETAVKLAEQKEKS